MGSKTNIHTTRKGEHRQLVNAKRQKCPYSPSPIPEEKWKDGEGGKGGKEKGGKRSTTLLHPYNGLFSRITQVSRHQKGKTTLDLYEARDDGVWERQ